MRTNIIKSLIFMAILVLGSCTEETRMPEVTKIAFPLIKLDPTSDVLIQGGKLNGKFSVDMFYKDYPVDSRVVVAMNGKYTDTKILKENVTAFPAVMIITDAQLVSLFALGSINPGDYFEVGLDVKMPDGKWYPAFNPKGVAYGSGPMNLPGASPIVTFKCPLPIDAFVGKYSCDEPAEDYSYDVSFSKVDANSISTANYWNSKWKAVFTVDFINKTYSMPLTKWDNYSAIESGTIDIESGIMVGNYTIYEDGTAIETGVHTYTRK